MSDQLKDLSRGQRYIVMLVAKHRQNEEAIGLEMANELDRLINVEEELKTLKLKLKGLCEGFNEQ